MYSMLYRDSVFVRIKYLGLAKFCIPYILQVNINVKKYFYVPYKNKSYEKLLIKKIHLFFYLYFLYLLKNQYIYYKDQMR